MTVGFVHNLRFVNSSPPLYPSSFPSYPLPPPVRLKKFYEVSGLFSHASIEATKLLLCTFRGLRGKGLLKNIFARERSIDFLLVMAHAVCHLAGDIQGTVTFFQGVRFSFEVASLFKMTSPVSNKHCLSA